MTTILPTNYIDLLGEIKRRIRSAQYGGYSAGIPGTGRVFRGQYI